jgi:hypothetical protein
MHPIALQEEKEVVNDVVKELRMTWKNEAMCEST